MAKNKALVEKYAKQKAEIIEKFNLVETEKFSEYNDMIFNTGLEFLSLVYNNDFGRKFSQKYSRRRTFWKWWQTKFKEFESEFFDDIMKIGKSDLKYMWTIQMIKLVYRETTYSSYYYQYLKYEKSFFKMR